MNDFRQCVYMMRHKPTNKVYIGVSRYPERRMYQHLSALRRGAHAVPDMQADFDTFGESYELKILEEITFNRMREYYWMAHFCSHIRGRGYNYLDRSKRMKLDEYATESNTLQLEKRIAASGLIKRTLASYLGMASSTFSRKLAGKQKFTESEMQNLDRLLSERGA